MTATSRPGKGFFDELLPRRSAGWSRCSASIDERIKSSVGRITNHPVVQHEVQRIERSIKKLEERLARLRREEIERRAATTRSAEPRLLFPPIGAHSIDTGGAAYLEVKSPRDCPLRVVRRTRVAPRPVDGPLETRKDTPCGTPFAARSPSRRWLCSLPPAPVGADVAPGDVINKANADKVKDIMSPAMFWCVQHGWPMKIVETQAPSAEAAYNEATEKYSAQVKLGDDGLKARELRRRPAVPERRHQGPIVAIKIMWNFNFRARLRDDLDLRNFDADTGPISDDRPLQVERHFLVDHFRRSSVRRPALRRSQARDPEQREVRVQGDPPPADRAVRSEGRRLHLLPLLRSRRSRTTAGSTCRRSAASAASRPRSAPTRSSARTPTRTATADTPARSPGRTGSSSARRKCSARSTPRTSR